MTKRVQIARITFSDMSTEQDVASPAAACGRALSSRPSPSLEPRTTYAAEAQAGVLRQRKRGVRDGVRWLVVRRR